MPANDIHAEFIAIRSTVANVRQLITDSRDHAKYAYSDKAKRTPAHAAKWRRIALDAADALEKEIGTFITAIGPLQHYLPCDGIVDFHGCPEENFASALVVLADDQCSALRNQLPDDDRPLLESADLDALVVRVMHELSKAEQRAEEIQKTTRLADSGDSEFVTAEKLFTPPSKTLAIELTVDVPSQRATLRTAKGEESFDLSSEGVARWLKVLAEHPGQWFVPSAYKEHDKQLDGVKPTDKLRSLKKKCPILAEMIEATKRSGMRFDPLKARK